MTITTPQASPVPAPADEVTATIDGVEVSVPKGTLVIRAAEQLGIQIPRFCDHPLLAPAGACRQCLVEVALPDREGNVRPMPKPQASCTLEVTPGMVVRTQVTSAVAEKAQRGVLELLLINHPLDCPVCDKGGECPLQNQALSNGRPTSRFIDVKRTFPKPIAVSTEILLDRERCVLCQRCTRFSREIAGDPFIDLQLRGARQQVGRFDEGVLGFVGDDAAVGTRADLPHGDCGHGAAPDAAASPEPEPEPGLAGGVDAGPADGAPVLAAADPRAGASALDESGSPFGSYFSGNTVQICPVGALTGSAYRFRSRPFDLVSTESVAEHDSSGAAIRIDHRRGVVLRRLAGEDPEVNEEWITDKDRFAFAWQTAPDRLDTPFVRDRGTGPDGRPVRGELRPASWAEAVSAAAAGLRAAVEAGGAGVLPGGRLTVEDAYAYAKLARVALGTNDVDHRARPHSAEEHDFLAHAVAGAPMGVTFSSVERAPAVLLLGLEAEEEAGVVFLRLRKGMRAHGLRVLSVAPYASRGLERLDGTLLPAVPGAEAQVIDAIAAESADEAGRRAAEALSSAGAVILVGERLALAPGALSAAVRLADRTGAALAWVPRRAGERGGVETGTLPGLLPGGRLVSDPDARVDVAAVWGVASVPSAPGRDTSAILAALREGRLGGAVLGGLELADLPDPAAAREALGAAGFVVSLEVRRSEAAELADVVFPVAPPAEKEGAFWNWEGRLRPFPQALASSALPDRVVLDALGEALGAPLGLRSLDQARGEIEQLAGWDGLRGPAPEAEPGAEPTAGPGQAVLATWRLLLDAGRGQDGERFLAGTAKQPVARLSPATAQGLGVAEGDNVAVSRPDGARPGRIVLPVTLADMPDGVVWLPTNSAGSAVREALALGHGDLVALEAAPTDGLDPAPAGAPDAPPADEQDAEEGR